MIIEGLLTSEDESGQAHVAPMGPVVDEQLQNWTLRPFQTSNTFACLRHNPNCVFHVTDDVLSVVKALVQPTARMELEQRAEGWIVPSACHWYQLRIDRWDLSAERSQATATVQATGTLRRFWGWNRAKHALLEAAILATRVHLLATSDIESQLAQLSTIVDKTAGPREFEAWKLLNEHLSKSH